MPAPSGDGIDRGWTVERLRGRASAFHARTVPDAFQRSVWSFEVTAPAVVLGSTQSPDVVDVAATTRAGVDLVRRRSGGGAVWLAPGEVTWVDVLLPADDPLAETDVCRSARWLGEVWARALGRLGVDGVEVHAGPMERTGWSDRACFAGLAPGEVTVVDDDGTRRGSDGRGTPRPRRNKVVGISQRRTRAGARFQCAVLHHWDPAALVDSLALAEADRSIARADLLSAAVGLDDLIATDVSTGDVLAAFLAELP